MIDEAIAAITAILLLLNPNAHDTTQLQNKQTTPTQTKASGWIPYWDTTAIDKLHKQNIKLTEISLFNHDTIIQNNQTTIITHNQDMAQNAAKLNTHTWATITDQTPAGHMANLINTKTGKNTHINQILKIAKQKNIDGIDLDYEKFAFADNPDTWKKTKPAWEKFITNLSAKLHQQNDLLSVTIPAMTSETDYWVYSPKHLGKYSDQVRSMAYDYSWNTPGNIAPDSWWYQVENHMKTQIPPQKLRIGIAAYSKDWVVKNTDGKPVTKGLCPDKTNQNTTSYNSSVATKQTTQNAYKNLVTWTRTNGEKQGTYWAQQKGTKTIKTTTKTKTGKKIVKTSHIETKCLIQRTIYISDYKTALDRTLKSQTPLVYWHLSAVGNKTLQLIE